MANDLALELHYGGAWHDVTGDRRTSEDIVITRGYSGETRQATVAKATAKLNNRGETYNPGNATSPLWGLAGRNTPCRIALDGAGTRLHGEVSSWKPRRSKGGDSWTQIEVSGVRRRIGQGTEPELSVLHRTLAGSSPTAYWRLEDGETALNGASAVAGQPALIASGAVGFAQADAGDGTGLVGSDNVVAFTAAAGSASLTATGLVVSQAATSWRFEFALRFAEPVDGITTLLRFTLASGVVVTLNVSGFDDWTTSIVTLNWADTAGNQGSISSGDGFWDNGQWRWIRVEATENGGSTDFSVSYGFVSPPVELLADTEPVAFSAVSRLTINPDEAAGWEIGHPVLWAPWPGGDVDTYEAFGGYWGETAADRLNRLCTEQGIAFTLVGVAADSMRMDLQETAAFTALLDECAATDGGLLFEARDSLGLVYRTRHDLYNGPAALELDFAAGQIGDPIDPDIDDKATRNDITVKHPAGDSASREKLTGPMSVLPPPNGVGRTATQVDVAPFYLLHNLHQIAGWHLHLGTCDETRWPRITVDLNAAPHLAAAAAAVDVGDVITVDNLDPGQVRLLVLGYTEVIGTHRHTITFHCMPQSLWEVWQLDTAGSTLTKDAAADATTLTLDTSAGPEWSTSAEPYHVQVDGEAMTVTAMATDTAAFVASGTVAHADNDSVTPGLPAGLAEGHLLLCLAAIRNSGTGTVDLPAGWTSLAESGNVRVFAKYAGASEAAPTVTFTGGVAGATCSARLVAFSGLSVRLDDGAYATTTPSPQAQLNSSSDSIAYPGLSVRRDGTVVILAGWKQDDHTGVSAVAGFTEAIDSFTTTGDDQSIFLQFRINTAAAGVTAGSVTCSGAVSAINRAIVLALRPTQTATVTRAVNNVSKAVTVGEAVTGWRLGVIAL